MDKVTCIAFLLYHSSKNQDIKEKAIQLLNGDATIRELKRNVALQPLLVVAESVFKKKKINKDEVQRFVEEFMFIEV